MLYLVFMKNRATAAEFALPVQAENRPIAENLAAAQYPSEKFYLLTTYSAPELTQLVAAASRWPGVPSNVAAAKGGLTAALSHNLHGPKVSTRLGGLPPLTQALKAAAPTAGQVQYMAQQMATAQPAQAAPAPTLADALAALRGKTTAVQAKAQTSISVPQPSAKPTLAEALRALRN